MLLRTAPHRTAKSRPLPRDVSLRCMNVRRTQAVAVAMLALQLLVGETSAGEKATPVASEMRAAAANATAVDSTSVIDRLPLSDAIVHRKGKGRRRMAVFADPNCPYCRKLEFDLSGIQDVTVYTFLVPVLAASSSERSRNIWCAADPAQAWHDWMLRSVPAQRSAEGCDHGTLQRNLQLARRVGLAGTPGMIFESGRWIMGTLDQQTLDLYLTRESVVSEPRTDPRR